MEKKNPAITFSSWGQAFYSASSHYIKGWGRPYSGWVVFKDTIPFICLISLYLRELPSRPSPAPSPPFNFSVWRGARPSSRWLICVSAANDTEESAAGSPVCRWLAERDEATLWLVAASEQRRSSQMVALQEVSSWHSVFSLRCYITQPKGQIQLTVYDVCACSKRLFDFKIIKKVASLKVQCRKKI